MLKPLVTQFKVIGNGLSTLKEIKKSYDNLRSSFRKDDKKIGESFKKSTGRFGDFVKKIKSGTVKIGNYFKHISNKADSELSKIGDKGNSLLGVFGKLTAILSSGFVIKTTFDNATDLEMARTSIVAMRGEERANNLMNYGIDFANTTPFETSEVLNATKKLELRGLDPTKWLRGIGDMSAMLGKSLDQGVEAVLDAVTGEFERLKEFGLTSKMLREMFPTRFDTKGSITDIKGFVDDLMKYLQQKYKGGTQYLANTTKGMMSTLKGSLSSFGNMLFSGTETGQVLEKSPLWILREKVISPLIEKLNELKKDGTLKRWSDSFARGFEKIFDVGQKVFSFIWKYRKEIGALVVGYIEAKITMAIFTKSIILLVKWLTKGIRSLFGFKDLLFGIAMAVSTTITYIGFNLDKIKDKFYEVKLFLRELWEEIAKIPKGIFNEIIKLPEVLRKGLISILSEINKIVFNIFVNPILSAINKIKDFFNNFSIPKPLQKVMNWFKKDKESALNIAKDTTKNYKNNIINEVQKNYEINNIKENYKTSNISENNIIKNNLKENNTTKNNLNENIINRSNLNENNISKNIIKEKPIISIATPKIVPVLQNKNVPSTSNKEKTEKLKQDNYNNKTTISNIDRHSNNITININGATNPDEIRKIIERSIYERELRKGIR